MSVGNETTMSTGLKPSERQYVYQDTVRLNHTDAFGVLYWASATLFAQRGVEELFALAGSPLASYLGSPIDYVVREAKVEYLSPLRLGMMVEVVTEIVHVGNTSFIVESRVSSADGPALVIRQVFVGINQETHVAVPVEEWVRKFGPDQTT